LAAAVASFPTAVSAGTASPDDFGSTWGDGKAELDGYTLVQPQSGQIRHGKAVMIFMTDDHAVQDHVPLLIFHSIRTFQTGMEDYKILGSVLCRLDTNVQPTKISVGLQEWDGQENDQLTIDGRKVWESLHSDLRGETDQDRKMRAPANVLFEDTVPILVRELQGKWMEPGATLEAPCAPSLLSLRLQHKPFAWGTIKITKAKTLKDMGSVLGEIPVRRWTVETSSSGIFTYYVESDWPHRIVQWSNEDGESGVLTGSTRLPYWKLRDNGDEKYLKNLGWPVPGD
jgi:hypothetical protein